MVFFNFNLLIKDSIYVVGGNDGQNILNMVELYDYKTKKISRLSDLKEKRDELAVTFGLDNKIYAMGILIFI